MTYKEKCPTCYENKIEPSGKELLKQHSQLAERYGRIKAAASDVAYSLDMHDHRKSLAVLREELRNIHMEETKCK